MRKLNDCACMVLSAGDSACAERLLAVLLDHVPAFEEGYRALFKSQIERTQPLLPILLPVVWVKIHGRGRYLFRGDSCAKLMSYVRRLVAFAPRQPSVLRFASAASRDVGFGALAIDLLELCVKYNPEDVNAWWMLDGHYLELGQARKRLTAVQHLTALLPGSQELSVELEQALAKAAVEKRGAKELFSPLDNKPDGDVIQALEQKLPGKLDDDEALRTLLTGVLKTVENQASAATLRTAGDLRMRLGEPNAALADYEHAFELSKSLDSALDDCITAAEMACLEVDISKWREFIETNPERSEIAERKIKSLEADKRRRLRERYEELLVRYPTEFSYRLELGELLVSQGMHSEALPHFEAAQCCPELCPKALLGAGKCMIKQDILDLAQEQLEGALRLGDQFSQRQRLETLFALGEVHEKLGSNQDAVDLYKKVYAIDPAFADVGVRLQALRILLSTPDDR